MKRLVHIIFSFKVGGAEHLIIDMLNEQIKTYECYLVVINDELDNYLFDKINPKVKVFLLKRKRSSTNPFYAIKLNFLFLTIRPDIVHCHNPNIIGLLLFKPFTILTLHNVNHPLNYLSRYDQLVAISTAVRDDIAYRSSNKLIPTIIYNGIMLDNFERKMYKSPPPRFHLLQISRLYHNQKGQDLLIEAVDCIVNIHKILNINISFVGSGSSLSYLKNLVKTYNLNNHVEFLGDKDRDWVYKNLHQFDILIQPSRFEGFGLTVVEAMAANVPVIASDLDGPREILENGKYGITFTTENVQELVQSIFETIKKIENGLINLETDAAHKRAISNFSLSNMVEKYNKAYEIN